MIIKIVFSYTILSNSKIYNMRFAEKLYAELYIQYDSNHQNINIYRYKKVVKEIKTDYLRFDCFWTSINSAGFFKDGIMF